MADYLTQMATKYPHDLFQEEPRASAATNAFDLAGVAIVEKQNLAPHKRRHNEFQRFMLLTDSVTVAVEVPVYLTSEDIRHLQDELSFNVPLPGTTTLTGHIDILQIRNGWVHILDYKPGAVRERPIAQLMVYA